MKKRIVLPLAPGKPAIMALTELPGFRGDEPYDLICAGCGGVIGESISLDFFANTIAGQGPFIVKCPCGSHSQLPAKRTDN